jgi:hypothetical protein
MSRVGFSWYCWIMEDMETTGEEMIKYFMSFHDFVGIHVVEKIEEMIDNRLRFLIVSRDKNYNSLN